jgi:hypothetical protein
MYSIPRGLKTIPENLISPPPPKKKKETKREIEDEKTLEQ